MHRLPDGNPKATEDRQGDVSHHLSAGKYDVVAALFHVACYQTDNRALKGLFQSARSALHDDGVFFFDFWYGPAVLSEKPSTRVKRRKKAGSRIVRLAEPVLHVDRNVVEVTYTLIDVDEPTGRTCELT